MNTLDVGVLPSKVMFAIWLRQLIATNKARFTNNSKKVIELGTYASSHFAIGRRRDTNHPIIAFPEQMMPWFASLDINTCILTKDNGIYIGFGSDRSEFFLRIASNAARIRALKPKEDLVDELTRTIDFHCYSELDGEVRLSRTLNRTEIAMIDNISSIIAEELTDDYGYLDSSLLEEIDFEDWTLVKDFLDPLPDDYINKAER